MSNENYLSNIKRILPSEHGDNLEQILNKLPYDEAVFVMACLNITVARIGVEHIKNFLDEDLANFSDIEAYTQDILECYPTR